MRRNGFRGFEYSRGIEWECGEGLGHAKSWFSVYHLISYFIYQDLKISHEVFFSPFSTSRSAGLASMHH